MREWVPIRNKRPLVREPDTNGNHAPISQEQNGDTSDSQEILVSMENMHPEGTEDQSITFPSGEALRRNVHVMRSERIRKSTQPYNPGFGDPRDWKNDAVAIIVYMIQDGDLNKNVDMNDII